MRKKRSKPGLVFLEGCPPVVDEPEGPTCDVEAAAEALARIYYERCPVKHLASVTPDLWMDLAREDVRTVLSHVHPRPQEKGE